MKILHILIDEFQTISDIKSSLMELDDDIVLCKSKKVAEKSLQPNKRVFWFYKYSYFPKDQDAFSLYILYETLID
jgi:hypothetical protein